MSSREVVAIFIRFGFWIQSQRGSHIKLRRRGPSSERQTITVPQRREIPTGTLYEIFDEGRQYIPEEQLRPHFYTD